MASVHGPEHQPAAGSAGRATQSQGPAAPQARVKRTNPLSARVTDLDEEERLATAHESLRRPGQTAPDKAPPKYRAGFDVTSEMREEYQQSFIKSLAGGEAEWEKLRAEPKEEGSKLTPAEKALNKFVRDDLNRERTDEENEEDEESDTEAETRKREAELKAGMEEALKSQHIALPDYAIKAWIPLMKIVHGLWLRSPPSLQDDERNTVAEARKEIAKKNDKNNKLDKLVPRERELVFQFPMTECIGHIESIITLWTKCEQTANEDKKSRLSEDLAVTLFNWGIKLNRTYSLRWQYVVPADVVVQLMDTIGGKRPDLAKECQDLSDVERDIFRKSNVMDAIKKFMEMQPNAAKKKRKQICEAASIEFDKIDEQLRSMTSALVNEDVAQCEELRREFVSGAFTQAKNFPNEVVLAQRMIWSYFQDNKIPLDAKEPDSTDNSFEERFEEKLAEWRPSRRGGPGGLTKPDIDMDEDDDAGSPSESHEQPLPTATGANSDTAPGKAEAAQTPPKAKGNDSDTAPGKAEADQTPPKAKGSNSDTAPTAADQSIMDSFMASYECGTVDLKYDERSDCTRFGKIIHVIKIGAGYRAIINRSVDKAPVGMAVTGSELGIEGNKLKKWHEDRPSNLLQLQGGLDHKQIDKIVDCVEIPWKNHEEGGFQLRKPMKDSPESERGQVKVRRQAQYILRMKSGELVCISHTKLVAICKKGAAEEYRAKLASKHAERIEALDVFKRLNKHPVTNQPLTDEEKAEMPWLVADGYQASAVPSGRDGQKTEKETASSEEKKMGFDESMLG